MNNLRAPGTFPRRVGLTLLWTVAGAWSFTSLAAADAWGQDVPTEPVVAYHAPTDPGELLKVDEPMRRFFGERMAPHRGRTDQLRALLQAIMQPDGLNFTYDRELTSDARATFRQRRGNCVSYSFLVVAIAREFGFDASFQNVNKRLQWDRIGNLIISVRHMNVRVDLGREYYLIDLQPDVIAETVRADMQVIRDKRAYAEFYDTAGFFELLHGNPEAAMQYMILATTIDPDCAQAWANRAVMHIRFDNLAEARACFERALRADPKDLFTLEGYVGFLQRLGTKEDLRIAAKYERRAQSVRNRNPYYQQALAARALERGDRDAAEKLLRRAIALKGDETQFHEQWVQVLFQLGRDDDARRAAAKLEKLRRRLASDQVKHAP
jgi:tetratricopeptide (TPR) repeat protein